MTDLFDAAGTLREAYRRVDWAASPIGPVATWSPTLRGTLDLILRSRNPATLLWGPDLVLLYNEAYVQMIGNKHPGALGSPCDRVFAEIWDTIGPMLTRVAAGQGATWVEDMRLLMNRNAFLEETYFTFSYSAVSGPDGAIEGVLDIASETTVQVLGARRLELLSRLTDRLADVDDLPHLLVEAVAVLGSDPDDLTGADIVVADEAALRAGAVLPAEPSALEQETVLTETPDGRVARIRLTGHDDHAVFTTRLSPHLPVDEAYLGFLRLIGAALVQGLNRIRVREVERRAGAMERDMSEALQRSLLTAPAEPDHLQVAVRYQPAAEGARIGGDWYDSFPQPDNRLTVVVGDVTGHDRNAAAGMSQIRNLLRGISYALLKPPARVLTALNDAMQGLSVDVFATMVLAQIDLATHEMRWSNAGHPPPILLMPGGEVHLLETPPEVMLGTRFRGRRSNHTVALQPGAAVIFYTDGLVERRGASLDANIKVMTEALRGRHGLDHEQLCDLLLAQLATDTEDDVVLTVVRRRPA